MYSKRPYGEGQIYHYGAEFRVGLMGYFRLSACLYSGLKMKIAMIFAGTNKNLTSNSDLLGREKQIYV